MDPKQFLSSLRTFLPGAEEFLIKTLTSEVLSEIAKSELNLIQDKLNDLKYIALEPSNHSNNSTPSTILTPPSPFLSGSDDELPVITSVRSLAGDNTNSGDSNFSLRITDSDSNEHSQTITHPVIDNNACGRTNAYSSQNSSPLLARDHETHQNDARGYLKNGILSRHMSFNSETENSSALDQSSPSVEKSGTKEVEEINSQKRKRANISDKKKIKRSKLSELSKNRINNTVCVSIISSEEESQGNVSSQDSSQGLSIVNEERTTQILHPQICHDIPSDDTATCESLCNDDASCNDSESEENSSDNGSLYEFEDQSPTNFATTESVNIPPEFSENNGEPACNAFPQEIETSPVIDNSGTSCENSVESGSDCTIEISDEDLIITTPPRQFVDSPTDLGNSFKQNSKITDFFNPKVSSTETTSLSDSRNRSIFSSGSSLDSNSPPPPRNSSPTR